MHGHAFGLPWVKNAGSSVWTPADIPTLTFWAEARAADLWEDTGKTLPVVNLDPVRIWTPRSPMVDLAAPNDGARPAYMSTGMGGAQGVLFDRVDDYVRSATAGVAGAQTWILRWAWGGTISERVPFGQMAAGPTCNELWFRAATSLRVHFGQSGSSTTSVYAAIPSAGTGAHTTVITWDGVSPSATSSYTVTHDGSLCTLSVGSSLARPTATTSARTTVGARNADTANFFFDGYVGVVIVASGVLTGGDLTDAIAYADGWALWRRATHGEPGSSAPRETRLRHCDLRSPSSSGETALAKWLPRGGLKEARSRTG